MISKELLSVVLYGNPNLIDSLKLNDIIGAEKNIQYISKVSGRPFDYINIYELAHLCKEWLENNTYWDVMIIGYEVYLMEDIWGESGARTHKRFTTEREWYLNLFKASQYILEQKGIK